MLYLSICVFDFEAGQVCQWPCSRRRHASGSARIASGRMCTFTAQVAALPPRASRPHPVWPTGAGLSAFLSCAHPPPLSGGTCCGAVPHCAAPANRRLLFSTLLLPRWCADSAFDDDGVYTMDLLPDFQNGIPAPPRPPPHLPSPFPASLFCLPCCLAHTMLVHGRMSLLPCALWTDSSFFSLQLFR